MNKTKKFLLYSFCLLLPIGAGGYFWQSGNTVHTYYGFAVGLNGTSTPAMGGMTVGTSCGADVRGLAVGNSVYAGSNSLAVGDGSVATPSPSLHFQVRGGSSANSFEVYGNRVVIPATSNLIITTPSGDIPTYTGN